jgi:hypothetical protein
MRFTDLIRGDGDLAQEGEHRLAHGDGRGADIEGGRAGAGGGRVEHLVAGGDPQVGVVVVDELLLEGGSNPLDILSIERIKTEKK